MTNRKTWIVMGRGLLAGGLLLLLPALAAAHELVLLSDSSGGLIPVVHPTPHLSGGAVVDLGSVPPGQPASQGFVLSNVSDEVLSITVGTQAPFTVSPAGVFTLSPGAQMSVTVGYDGSGSPGDHQGLLVASSTHTGVVADHEESWPITVHVQSPPVLRLHFPTLGESDVSVLDLGYLSNQAGVDGVGFPMTIENVGEATAKNVQFVQPGGLNVSGQDCSLFETELPLTFCVSLNGALPRGFEVPGTAAGVGGNSVELTWRFVPERDGFFGQDFQLTLDNGATKNLRLRGGVVDLDFGSAALLRGTGGQVQGFGENPAFARRTDPFGGDPFESFAPSGFDAKTAFSVGDFDNVETRTGNLVATIPLGGEVRSAGGLSYSLSAVFNGRVWAQETMYRTDLVEQAFPDNDQGPVHPRFYEWAFTAEYFDPAFNNGQGWSVHLGRLIEPDSNFFQDGGPGCDPLDPACWEGRVRSGGRYVYVDPAGTKRELYRSLHGEEIYNDCPLFCYENATYLYTRDGSYLRLKKVDTNTRVLQFPDGRQHTFKKGNQPTLLEDDWHLTSMTDRQGNLVTVTYGTNLWTITEAVTGRTTEVEFRVGSEGRRQVKEVRLPGFGGTSAVRRYTFNYGPPKTISRSPRSTWHTYLKDDLHHPLDSDTTFDPLTSITRPDGTSWSFSYTYGAADNDLRMGTLTLPTGAKADYGYSVVHNPAPYCAVGFNRGALDGVVRRTVKDRDGMLLEDTRFLRQYRYAPSVPDDVCLAQPGFYSPNGKPPLAEQRTAVWSLHESTSPALSSVTVGYYSVYPLRNVCVEGTAGCTTVGGPGGKGVITAGWTNVENGLQMTRSQPDPATSIGGERYLSEELYQCDLGLGLSIPEYGLLGLDPDGRPYIGDDIDTLLGNASCEARSSTYRGYEAERAGNCDSNVQELCLRDSRIIDERTVYHTDSERWRRMEKSDFDGLGNYRRSEVSSDFEESQVKRTELTSYQNSNPDAGILVLDEDYKVDPVSSTFTVPDTWILGLATDHWVQGVDGARYGGELHHRSDGLVDFARTYAGSSRGTKDLVVSYTYDTYGNVTAERHFGANVYGADGNLPTGSGWTATSYWPSSLQDYAVIQTWSKGSLVTKRIDGSSVYEVNRTVDAGTGWTATETRNHGETLTYSYDGLGRVTGIDSNRGADVGITYADVARGTGQKWWQSTVTTIGRSDPAAGAATVSASYVANFDDLGRVIKETIPNYYDTDPIVRWTAYHPSGQVKSVTVPGNNYASTKFFWDVEGQLVERKAPDNRTITKYINVSPRRVRQKSWQNSATGAGLSETVVDFDPLGRVAKVQRPHVYLEGTSGAYQASVRYDYNGLGQLLHAWNGLQHKRYGRDGRGFVTSERIPELSGDETSGYVETKINSFDTRGNPLVVEKKRIGGGWLRRTRTSYDNLGRPTLVEAKDNATDLGSYRPLKSFTYYGSGYGKGLLSSATRHNYRTDTTGGGSYGAGDWQVTSDYGYDLLGRLKWKQLEVNLVTASGSSLAGPVTSVWEYDDFGNPLRAGYPDASCSITTCQADDAEWKYYKGTYLTDAILYEMQGSSKVDVASARVAYHPWGAVSNVLRSFGGDDTYGSTGTSTNGMPRISHVNLGASRRVLGDYNYDDRGLIVGIGNDTFSYDLDGRLTGATVYPAWVNGGSESRAYGYDRWDNFDDSSGMGIFDQTTNRFGGVGYDDFGNATSLGGGAFLLDYDQLDKHISTRTYSGGQVVDQVLSVYDHDDLRVVRADTTTARQEWTMRDPSGHVIRELAFSGGVLAPIEDYVWADDQLIGSKDYETGVRSQYHSDHLGTTRLITRADGTMEFVDYLPYGDPLPVDDPVAPSSERIAGFAGHESDGGSTYMRGRSYLQKFGRFLQVDPGRSGWNGYAYASNDPINRFDPNGLDDKPANGKKSIKLFNLDYSAAGRFNARRDQVVADATFEGGTEAGKEALREFDKDLETPAVILVGTAAVLPFSVGIGTGVAIAGTTGYIGQRLTGESDREALGGTLAAMLAGAFSPVGPEAIGGRLLSGVRTGVVGFLAPTIENLTDMFTSPDEEEDSPSIDLNEEIQFEPLDLEVGSDDVSFRFNDDPE